MIVNGGFTTDASNWTGTNGTLAAVAGGQSGKCLEITRTGGDHQNAASDAFVVVPGTKNTIVLWVKSGSSGNESFRAAIEEAGVEKAVIGATSSATWTAYVFEWLAVAASAVLKLYKNSATAGTMLFDTVSHSETPLTVYASTLFTEIDAILLDADKARWPDAEKLKYLNAGQRQSVIFKPDVYTINDVYKLAAGSKQSVPDGTSTYQNATGGTLKECIQLIRLVRNMGTNGLTAGAIIPPIGADMLDAYNPDWHTDTALAAVQNYIFNDDDPRHFYVTPPNLGTGYVEAVFSAYPADVVAAAGPSYDVAITLSNIYRDVLVNYILYRCYAKDAALSPYNAQRADYYWNLFVMGLERKDLVKKETNPNVKRMNPSTEDGRSNG